jgi:hypothetical protein
LAQATAHRLRSRAGKARDAQRKVMVQTVFGNSKQVRVFERVRRCDWGGIPTACLALEPEKNCNIRHLREAC